MTELHAYSQKKLDGWKAELMNFVKDSKKVEDEIKDATEQTALDEIECRIQNLREIQTELSGREEQSELATALYHRISEAIDDNLHFLCCARCALELADENKFCGSFLEQLLTELEMHALDSSEITRKFKNLSLSGCSSVSELNYNAKPYVPNRKGNKQSKKTNLLEAAHEMFEYPERFTEEEKVLINKEIDGWSDAQASFKIPDGIKVKDWLREKKQRGLSKEKNLDFNDNISATRSSVQRNLNENMIANGNGRHENGRKHSSNGTASSISETQELSMACAANSSVLAITPKLGSFPNQVITSVAIPSLCKSFTTDILKSFATSCNGEFASQTVKIFWNLKVKWPNWAQHIEMPKEDSPISKLCFMCQVQSDGHFSSDELSSSKNGDSALAAKSSIDIGSAGFDLLSHYVSHGHWNSVKQLQKRGFLDGFSSPIGKFFLQEHSTEWIAASMKIGNVEISERKNLEHLAQSKKQSRLANFTLRSLYRSNNCKILLKNIADCDVLLIYETCEYNNKERLELFSLRDSSKFLSVNKENNPTQYRLKPGAAEEFALIMATPQGRPLTDFLSFSALFLVVKLSAYEAGANKMFAEPLVITVDLCPK